MITNQMKNIKSENQIILLYLFILLMSGCQHVTSPNESGKSENHFFVGTYTDSTSLGIYAGTLKGDSIFPLKLTAQTVNPSYLALSPDKHHLLAVNEINQNGSGTIESYKVLGDSLLFVARSTTGGAHPCFVSVNRDGYVMAANYTGGNVGLLKIDQAGTLSPLLDIQQHIGHGVTPRQEAPHAHSAWFVPNENEVISVDLGTDELLFSSIDTVTQKFTSPDPRKYHMKSGDGPRHLAFHPTHSWIYVINELSCTVTQLQKINQNTYQKVRSVSTLPDGYQKPNTCADIHISANGKFLYASNRGHNSIAIYQIDDLDGSLTLLDIQSTRGDGPRNFALTRDGSQLLVANQHSDNLVLFHRNQETGLLTFVSEVKAPNPVCILFL
ncbi:MAG: 6-phosphogluconolactonase [Bacteroidetes bacterium CG18_big_fil_WC_8_21_14_2_50_41_14]|nr:MAG: 6-phosphogluconolactonase [Bacteroidetes bacterium CG18_big_fil_WC_8_21_14_2_50_41_14]PJB54976.1 MAG: 6-phosphogluconolactonase [Bacteroidetes bacterium CG_4_9_14_3_um_filter_41_19]